jgi:TRAP-type C4-dicarboxylate transport system substrate-binding protein
MSTDAMKGKKLRTWGSDMPRMAESVGAVGVNLSLTEVYEGLLRGVVDCIPFSVDLMKNYKMYEVAKHYHDITLWEGPTWGVWITETAWNKLSDEQKKIVEEVAEEARVQDLQAAKDAAAEAVGFLKEQGVKFETWPQAEKDKWRAALPDFFAEWIAKMEEKGKGDDARKAIDIWKQVVKENM